MGKNHVVGLEIRWVRPGEVSADERQPRRFFDPEGLAELADSIAEEGLQNPTVVREIAGGRLMIVSGERRWRACRMIQEGYSSPALDGQAREAVADFRMPVLVRGGDLEALQVLKLQLIENLQRSDMLPLEEARGYERLVEEFGCSRRHLGRMLGVPKTRIFRRLDLMRLPVDWQKRIDEGAVPLYVAELALMVPPEARSARSGVSALEDALEIASSARSKEEARLMLERRYVRPSREEKVWESGEMAAMRKREVSRFAEDVGLPDSVGEVNVCEYGQCRELFPFDEEALLPMNARGYVEARSMPGAGDGLAPGREDGGACWGELALRYGSPLFLACDGKMRVRLLCRSDLVKESVRLASASPEECVFAATTAEGIRRQNEEARRARELEERETRERAGLARRMVRALDAKVRAIGETGEPPGPLFFEAAFFCAQLGALGVSGSENPLLMALDAMGIARGDEIVLENWPGLFDDEGCMVAEGPAVMSLMLCGFLVYYLGRDEGPLLENEEWKALAEAYGIESEEVEG